MNQKEIFEAVKASQLFENNDFKVTQVEDHLIFTHQLEYKLDSEKTILRASGHFKTSELFHDFRIVTEEDLIKVSTFINFYLKEVQELFFIPSLDKVYIGSLIAVNDFKNQNKVLVGGKFPVHIMKKMFFLKIGGQEDRFKEYKEGLESLIRKYEKKKPYKKKDAEIMWKGYNYFIEKLESAPKV